MVLKGADYRQIFTYKLSESSDVYIEIFQYSDIAYVCMIL